MEQIKLNLPMKNIENILGTVTSPSIVVSELIKNAVDSNADNIRVDIFTYPENELVIEDSGDGLSYEDIKNLSILSVSNKKIDGHLFRKDGSFLAGSKGLGILSIFSIADEFSMETEQNGVRYRVAWLKGECSFVCEEIERKNKNGTKINITNLNNEHIAILTDETELNKIKHLSIKNYIKSNLSKKSIEFFINNRECKSLKITHFHELSNSFKEKVIFKYKSKENILYFQYLSQNSSISSKEVVLDFNKEIIISDILKKEYNLVKVIRKGDPNKYLNFMLDDFYGEIRVIEKSREDKLKNFGEGVRIFINEFAMYGYLDRQNDWLNLSKYSMQGKNTAFKPHNVFGYVHFENFNENDSHLKISNERAYFIENGAFKKFDEIMKNVITAMAFNINVAERNNLVDIHCSIINPSKDLNGKSQKEDTNNILGDLNNNSNSSIKNEAIGVNIIELTKKNINNESAGKIDDEVKSEIKDSNNKNNSSFNQICSVAIDKKPKFRFFNSSSVLKHKYAIEIEHHELIHQLSKLDYKSYYLLYVISFRAIIEDISKKYLNFRGINLSGDFGRNVRLMTDDILTIMKKNTLLINVDDKLYIENSFGGYNAFKNYFEGIGKEFYDNGKQAVKSTNLNSLTHNPRWMEIEEAENYSNNIILPLYFAYTEITKRLKK